MYQPGHPTPQPPKPPVSGVDIAVSITALVVTAVMIMLGGLFGLFSLAFLDHCPPESCSAEGAASAVFTAVLVAIGIGISGLIVTVVQLIRCKRGWPFAVITLALCVVALVLGVVGLSMAVG